MFLNWTLVGLSKPFFRIPYGSLYGIALGVMFSFVYVLLNHRTEKLFSVQLLLEYYTVQLLP